MKFRLIPPGEFTMGSTTAEIEQALIAAGKDEFWKQLVRTEAPQHQVILSQPIYLGLHEVTQAEYKQVMGKNPAHFSPTGASKGAVTGMDTTRHPVESVYWNDATEFCMKLSLQEKLKPFVREGGTTTLLDGTGYRLTTERNGSSRVARKRRPGSGMATRTKTSCRRGGSVPTREGGRTWLERCKRIHSDCMTFTAMFRNGYRTGGIRPTTANSSKNPQLTQAAR
jgi:hypothetical protein